jgi:sensor domain DACNV-containing protein
MTQPIVYPHDLVERLASTISALESEESSRATPPSHAQIERVLDAAWSATLLEEEGRRTVFTLGVVSEKEALATPCRVLAFADAMACDPHTIAKLALATDPRETVIGVRRSRDDALEIWGLLQLEERSVAVDHEIRPRFLHVTGFRPGGLVVESHARRLLLYMNGVAHWYERGAENITTLLRDALHPTARTLGSTGGALAHEFERLAERLVLAGQGGTLLIADGGLGRGVHVPVTTTFRSANTCLRDAFLKDEHFSRGSAPPGEGEENPARKRFDVERAHLRALDHVARLSNVDGAVVMGPDLCVFGFGATIDLTDETEIPPMELHDLTIPGTPPRSITVNEFLGHRHKSAVHFCAMQREGNEAKIALAIVASHDGALSLFGLAGTGIAVYRPFILRSVSVR